MASVVIRGQRYRGTRDLNRAARGAPPKRVAKRRRRSRKTIARRLVQRVVRKRRMVRARQIAAARHWTTVSTRGTKVPKAKGGGRVVPFASEAQRAEAKRELRGLATAEKNMRDGKPRAKCGTNAGYHSHRARNEQACEPCLKAHAIYNRRYS